MVSAGRDLLRVEFTESRDFAIKIVGMQEGMEQIKEKIVEDCKKKNRVGETSMVKREDADPQG